MPGMRNMERVVAAAGEAVGGSVGAGLPAPQVQSAWQDEEAGEVMSVCTSVICGRSHSGAALFQ